MTMTVRGALVGADYILDRLPRAAFTVRSWQDNVAHTTQKRVREELKKTSHVIESVFNPATRGYVGFVYASPQERNCCFREWASRAQAEA